MVMEDVCDVSDGGVRKSHFYSEPLPVVMEDVCDVNDVSVRNAQNVPIVVRHVGLMILNIWSCMS